MNSRPYVVEVFGTPEAGKTTTIKEVISSLTNKGYNVKFIQESAEIVPIEFEKASIEAHIWMKLHTAQNILHACASNAEIIIVDRGIVDSLFWDYLYFLRKQLSQKQLDSIDSFFKNLDYMPDFVIILTTSPEEAIIRRGGEGRIVTKSFLEEYNSTLNIFFEKNIQVPKYKFDTTGIHIEAVVNQMEQLILQHLTSQ